MESMGEGPLGWVDPRVARVIDANLDRSREGLRVVEAWCRFGLERDDLVVQLKDWRQRLGRLHRSIYKQARSTVVISSPSPRVGRRTLSIRSVLFEISAFAAARIVAVER